MPHTLSRRAPDVWIILGFSASVLLPGIAQVQKYGGWAALLAYLCIGTGLITLLVRRIPAILRAVTARQAWLAAATIIALLATAFFAVEHSAVPYWPGVTGSDAADALNVGARALLAGEYPYRHQTRLGNVIAPFPGQLLLAVPFYLLGNAAWQNIFWLAVLMVFLTLFLHDARPAALLLAFIICCPAVLQQFLTGGDRLTNSIYVFIFMLAAVVTARRRSAWSLQEFLLVLLGIALSSRANYILLFPLWIGYATVELGRKRALRRGVVVAGVLMGVTLPFYIHDPRGFAALYNQFSKVERFSILLPHSGAVITGATAALALGLAARTTSLAGFLRNCAIVQAVPVVMGTLLALASAGPSALWYADYGVNFLIFGLLSTWLYWQGGARVQSSMRQRSSAAVR